MKNGKVYLYNRDVKTGEDYFVEQKCFVDTIQIRNEQIEVAVFSVGKKTFNLTDMKTGLHIKTGIFKNRFEAVDSLRNKDFAESYFKARNLPFYKQALEKREQYKNNIQK